MMEDEFQVLQRKQNSVSLERGWGKMKDSMQARNNENNEFYSFSL